MASSPMRPRPTDHPIRPATEKHPRSQFIVALRAIAALIIVWHHFALYPPLRQWAAPLIGGALELLELHARATQVFFVVGGYVLAASLARYHWSLRQLGVFITQRYCRLGIPYLGAIALTLTAYVIARGYVPESVLGSPATVPQLLAHLVFLQGILGYEQLSAGLWFVCINFQLSLVYAFLLFLRDNLGRGRVDVVGLLGGALTLVSLFYVNLNDAWDNWCIYFFPYFFLGVVIHRHQHGQGTRWAFWLYQLLFIGAMIFEWRWRLLSASVVGLLIYHAEQKGWGRRWPCNRIILWLGDISYSLFLIHFPMLLLVATLWTQQGWTTPEAAVAGLLLAFVLSVLMAGVFNRWVERPSSRLRARPEHNGISLARESC